MVTMVMMRMRRTWLALVIAVPATLLVYVALSHKGLVTNVLPASSSSTPEQAAPRSVGIDPPSRTDDVKLSPSDSLIKKASHDDDDDDDDNDDGDNGDMNMPPKDEEEVTPAPPSSSSSSSYKTKCPSVLNAMRQGTWRQSMTEAQRKELTDIYRTRINNRNLRTTPFYHQRQDSRCGGNFSAPGRVKINKSSIPRYQHWPATCRPDGPTPCCLGEGLGNVCVNRSVEDCACPSCVDMRTAVFAEHATWRPEDERCAFPAFSREGLCSLLENRTLLMVGDSLARHFYMGLLMQLRGDEVWGAFSPSIDRKTMERHHCTGGMTMFRPGPCAGSIDYNAVICNGTARAKYVVFYHPSKGLSVNGMIDRVASELSGRDQRRSIGVLGIGSHYEIRRNGPGGDIKLYPHWALNDSLIPLLKNLSARGIDITSKLLWTTVHAKMNFKIAEVKREISQTVSNFNAVVMRAMREWGVPVFDTYNMTVDRVIPMDDIHYGLGVQRMKVHILFHYLRELRGKGLW